MIKSTLLLLAAALPVTAAPLPIAIGTHTGGGGMSKGIYLSTFDPDTGDFGEVKLGAKYSSPGFLALHPSKPLLYCVGSSDTHPKGSVAAFKLGDPLEFLGEASSGGAGPCHLAVDDSGKVLAVANYGDGSTAMLRLDEAGLPMDPVFSRRAEGKGPRADRQDGPHAHGVYFRGNLVHVPDLGIDRVLAYRIDPVNAKLAGIANPWPLPPGAGPRHMAFSPDGKHGYVVNELDNTVTAGTYDASAGSFETLHSISTLPADWKGISSTAEIEVHPSGKFVYASNRGHDSIAVFARDATTGKLESVGIAPCGGKVPRHFALAPGGRWLLCAHQNSDTISCLPLPLDPGTGMPGAPAGSAKIPNPICILFLP